MRKILVPLLIAALLVGALSVAVDAQTTWQKMENVWVKALKTTNNADVGGALSVSGITSLAGALNASGNTTVGGTFAVNGSSMAVAGLFATTPQAAIAVTDGGVITPTGALQRLTSTGNVTATLAAGNAGDRLTLFNSSNTTILIEDTTGQVLAGNASLGQWDTLSLFFYGTSWIESGRSNN